MCRKDHTTQRQKNEPAAGHDDVATVSLCLEHQVTSSEDGKAVSGVWVGQRRWSEEIGPGPPPGDCSRIGGWSETNVGDGEGDWVVDVGDIHGDCLSES